METGLSELDKMTGGFQPGQVIAIASRPGMGKRVFAHRWALKWAKEENTIVFFSLESTKEEVEKAISSPNIIVDDSPALTADDIFDRCIKTKTARSKLDLVIIDYLQLMSYLGPSKERVSENMRRIKEAAKALECPIIVLSQVGRLLESRSNKRPMLTDLRESAPIESSADIIMFIYRDDYYDRHSPRTNIAEIIVAKNRLGDIGTVKVRFE